MFQKLFVPFTDVVKRTKNFWNHCEDSYFFLILYLSSLLAAAAVSPGWFWFGVFNSFFSYQTFFFSSMNQHASRPVAQVSYSILVLLKCDLII